MNDLEQGHPIHAFEQFRLLHLHDHPIFESRWYEVRLVFLATPILILWQVHLGENRSLAELKPAVFLVEVFAGEEEGTSLKAYRPIERKLMTSSQLHFVHLA